ncbi:hypothetical protein [Panacagrimonas sp.]|uniref:hypothetical protein n=1 Tax=Panacagrimonas sp. TaxID=2480088 RepID=UPI003B52B4EC
MRALGHRLDCADLGGWLPPGGSVHIVLSGPSIATIAEPTRLAMRPTVVVNGSFRVLLDAGCSADLYVVSDVGFVRRQWSRFVAGVRASRALALDHRVLLEVLRRDPEALAGKQLRLFDNLLRPYGRSARWWSGAIPATVRRRDRTAAFSVDPAFGYFPSCTVAYLALQMAASQRPARIVLFGLDLGGARRYYDEAQPEQSMLQRDLQRCILPHLRLAAQTLADLGIAVHNASPDSAVPASIFPRMSPSEYLQDLHRDDRERPA